MVRVLAKKGDVHLYFMKPEVSAKDHVDEIVIEFGNGAILRVFDDHYTLAKHPDRKGKKMTCYWEDALAINDLNHRLDEGLKKIKLQAKIGREDVMRTFLEIMGYDPSVIESLSKEA